MAPFAPQGPTAAASVGTQMPLPSSRLTCPQRPQGGGKKSSEKRPVSLEMVAKGARIVAGRGAGMAGLVSLAASLVSVVASLVSVGLAGSAPAWAPAAASWAFFSASSCAASFASAFFSALRSFCYVVRPTSFFAACHMSPRMPIFFFYSFGFYPLFEAGSISACSSSS